MVAEKPVLWGKALRAGGGGGAKSTKGSGLRVQGLGHMIYKLCGLVFWDGYRLYAVYVEPALFHVRFAI